MATTEKKLQATKLLLSILTDIMIEQNGTEEAIMKMADEHRTRFNLASDKDPELFAAGMEIATELSDEAQAEADEIERRLS